MEFRIDRVLVYAAPDAPDDGETGTVAGAGAHRHLLMSVKELL
ncbi:hypothetical protein [Streptomyces sp. NRRL B-1140]|nr:hypothetical protein [Streptomyces sp. NRRL B-1140]